MLREEEFNEIMAKMEFNKWEPETEEIEVVTLYRIKQILKQYKEN